MIKPKTLLINGSATDMCLNDWFTLSFAQQNIKERLEKARKDTKKAQNLAEFISIYLKHVWGGGGGGGAW